jgi:hypothetical protein
VKSDDYAAFEEILQRAADLTMVQQNKAWRSQVTALFEELAEYDLEAIQAAVRDHTRSEKFFPTLADIVRRLEGTAEDRAALAWGMALRAIQRHGRSASVFFPSPAHVYAIEQMGGWVRLCSSLAVDEEKWTARVFGRFFSYGERVASWDREPGKVVVPRYCVGQCERNNRSDGRALPAIIDAATGQPVKTMDAVCSGSGSENLRLAG